MLGQELAILQFEKQGSCLGAASVLLSWYFWPMKSTVGLALCARQRDAPTGDIGRTT